MNRFIDEEKVREIQGMVDIVEIISQHVLLKKAGSNFKGLCPFHPEKTPSFTVSAEKQIFHCFGCGTGGNVFHFLMKQGNLSFPEAVKHLAEREGIVLPEEGKGERIDRLRGDLLRVNALAADYFHKQLIQSHEGKKAKEYLLKRGFTEDTAVRFKIGFSLEEWNSLGSYLVSQGIDYNLMEKAGFVIPRKDDKGYYDRFRGRLMFPIFNSWGEVIAFGGRTLSDSLENVPKYMNSPETHIYKKGKNLYGLNWAKEAIRKEKRAIIVEGYLDLIRVVEAGLENGVATLGTALTKEQVQLLKGFAEEVVFVYDGDPAGKRAMERGQELLMESSLLVKVIPLPEGNDPDSFIKKKGPKAFLDELNRAKLYPVYFMEQILTQHNIGIFEEKVKAVQKVIHVLSKIPSYIERADYTKMLAEKVDLPEEAILAEMKKAGNMRRIVTDSGLDHQGKTVRSVEYQFCQVIVQRPEIMRSVQDEFFFEEEGLFQDKHIKQIVDTVSLLLNSADTVTSAEIIAALSDEESRNLVTQMLLKPAYYEDPEVALRDFLNFVKKTRLQEQVNMLSKDIKEAEFRGEINRLRVLQKEYQRLKIDLAHLF